jgi:hypothetical protein
MTHGVTHSTLYDGAFTLYDGAHYSLGAAQRAWRAVAVCACSLPTVLEERASSTGASSGTTKGSIASACAAPRDQPSTRAAVRKLQCHLPDRRPCLGRDQTAASIIKLLLALPSEGGSCAAPDPAAGDPGQACVSSEAAPPIKSLLGSGAVCITGAHGIGKTTLVTHVGWEMFKEGLCPGAAVFQPRGLVLAGSACQRDACTHASTCLRATRYTVRWLLSAMLALSRASFRRRCVQCELTGSADGA